MTLLKAIKDLLEILDTSKPLGQRDYKPAITLGIEALQHIQKIRLDRYVKGTLLLPSETLDDNEAS